jgi:hypothetical protein
MLTAGEVPADLRRVWLLGYFPRRLSQLIEPCVRSRLSLFGTPNGGSLRFGGAVSQVDRRLSNGAADERTRRTAASASHTPLQSYSRWWAEKGLFHRCLVKSSQAAVTGPRCSRSGRAGLLTPHREGLRRPPGRACASSVQSDRCAGLGRSVSGLRSAAARRFHAPRAAAAVCRSRRGEMSLAALAPLGLAPVAAFLASQVAVGRADHRDVSGARYRSS